jgi:hypothetical protein
MLALRTSYITPPGGYRYYDADLDQMIAAVSLDALVREAAQMRKINGLPPVKDFAKVVEDYICSRLPVELTKQIDVVSVRGAGSPSSLPSPIPHGNDSPFPGLVLRESECVSRTMALLRRAKVWLHGHWAAAAPRIHTCRACAMNVREPCCYSCKIESVFAASSGIVPPRTTDVSFMGVCAADLTFLKAVIPTDDPDAYEVYPRRVYPRHCWKLKKEIITDDRTQEET